MKLDQRSQQLEWLDLGSSYYTPQEYADCLFQLDRIGRYLGGDCATFWAFKQLKHLPNSILDVGCGGGLFTIRLAQHYPQAKVMGIDISSEAIEFAKKQPCPPNVEFYVPPSPQLHYAPHTFDVITATLVCHHLKDEELVAFLKNAYHIAKSAVILNDLHRYFLAALGFKVLAPLLFPNRLIEHDGLLSVQRAFKRQDWVRLLQAANIPPAHFSITWHWAFRWMVIINPSP